jgi:CreA protein
MRAKAITCPQMPWKRLALATVALTLGLLQVAAAADEPDLIFRRSTVFKWISPNDKLATYGVDDPEVEGVACHFTVPEKGGFKGWLGVAEEVSDISLACRQIGPIRFKDKMSQGDDMFRQRRSLFFKKMQIVRGCDARRSRRRRAEVRRLHPVVEEKTRTAVSSVRILACRPGGGLGDRDTRRGAPVSAARTHCHP